jgi:hypothetical protein
MKTTIDVSDVLLKRAKRRARREGRTLRALVEEGLRRVLDDPAPPSAAYVLPDCSVGDPDAEDPLAGRTWAELRDAIYGEP